MSQDEAWRPTTPEAINDKDALEREGSPPRIQTERLRIMARSADMSVGWIFPEHAFELDY
jgi:hypothetical protein